MPLGGHLHGPVVELVRDEEVAGGIEVLFRGTRWRGLSGLSRAAATTDNERDEKTQGDQERASEDCHRCVSFPGSRRCASLVCGNSVLPHAHQNNKREAQKRRLRQRIYVSGLHWPT